MSLANSQKEDQNRHRAVLWVKPLWKIRLDPRCLSSSRPEQVLQVCILLTTLCY